MFPRFSTAALAAALLSTPVTALAAETGGFTVEVFGGLSRLSDMAVTGDVDGDASFGGGQIAGLAVGYDYADRPVRAEIEFAYRSDDAETFAGGATGDFASTTLMVNGYYDFQSFGALTPYIGAGLGYVTEIDFDVSGGAAPGEYNARGGVAFQAMIGAGYNLGSRVFLTGEIRRFDAGDQTLDGPGGSLTADYATTDVLFGVGVRF